MSNTDALDKGKKLRRIIKSSLLSLFGYCDTDTSFYLLPPTDASRVELIVLESLEQAKMLLVKIFDPEFGIADLTSLQWSGQVLAIRTDEMHLLETMIKRGVKAGAIAVIHRAQFDPRGGLLDNWTDEELRLYVSQVNLAKTTKGLSREELVTLIRDDFYGVTGSGTANEDPEDETAKRLVKIFDKLAKSEPLRGKVKLFRDLSKSLLAHRDNNFEHGRKRRISELKRMVAMVSLKDREIEGITEALVEMGRM